MNKKLVGRPPKEYPLPRFNMTAQELAQGIFAIAKKPVPVKPRKRRNVKKKG